MKRVAIVVPRWHPNLVGGAEALAWQYATLLADAYKVHLLTSTAMSYVHWDNELASGIERCGAVTIRRFRVARGRGGYFHDLHRRLLADVARGAAARHDDGARITWPEALQEEFIRAQGPLCPDLVEHLGNDGDTYDALVFLTYLYPTTYDGVRALAHRRWALVPTLHDEAPAYFSAFAAMARATPRMLWNTAAEQRLGARLWGDDGGRLVSMAVATARVDPAVEATPYLLYSGRIDTHKGCAALIAGFESYKRARHSNLRLLLTGVDELGVRETADVACLGFVADGRKLALMAGAVAFVHPSRYESLSIVTLEAMAQGTPVIVNGDCEILADHVAASGSGFVFRGEAELHACIDAALALDAAARQDQAARARRYVTGNYGVDEVRARLVEEIEGLAAR